MKHISFAVGTMVSFLLCGMIVYCGQSYGGDIAAIFAGPTILIFFLCLAILFLSESNWLTRHLPRRFEIIWVNGVAQFATGFILITASITGTVLLFFILIFIIKD